MTEQYEETLNQNNYKGDQLRTKTSSNRNNLSSFKFLKLIILYFFILFSKSFSNKQPPTKTCAWHCLAMVKSGHWWVNTILCGKKVFGDLHFPLVLLVAVAGPKFLLCVLVIELLIRWKPKCWKPPNGEWHPPKEVAPWCFVFGLVSMQYTGGMP